MAWPTALWNAPMTTPTDVSFQNRVTEMLGVEIPILSAPMGWIAQPPLVAAVSGAGAMGMIPGSMGTPMVRNHIHQVRELTDKPFGVNLPIAFLKDQSIIQLLVDEGVRFVTTSAGSPDAFTARLRDAGLNVFHVVPSLKAARKAVDAGVHGLVVEGSEGAGFKSPRDVSSMVLLPRVTTNVGVPVIAAGGMADGASMAAAFALGAEGVQMGTRMVATAESGVHMNMKTAVVAAEETDTMLINQHNGRPVRVLRTGSTAPFELAHEGNPMALLENISDLYERGDLDASLPQLGQVAGRIASIEPAADVIRTSVAEFAAIVGGLAARYKVR